MIPAGQTFGLTRPRFSSDTSLLITDAQGAPAIVGVADMIGRPAGLRWRNYMKTAVRLIRKRLLESHLESLEERAVFLQEQLSHHNRIIREVSRHHDQTAFGFCIAAAAVAGAQCSLNWLGDCRAYRIRRVSGRSPAIECRVLTQDHNALETMIRSEGARSLFRGEMQELGKTILYHLGTDPDRADAVLLAQQVTLELERGECLLFMTDGVTTPLTRVLLNRNQDLLDNGSLYLENFLSEWLSEQPEALDRELPWEIVVRRLVQHVELFTHQYPTYRDDIAVTGYFLPS